MVREAVIGLWHILRAMGLTLRYFFSKPVTVQYPEQPVHIYPRFRGRHELLRYEEGPHKGLERCIGCALCAAYCPTQCIYVQAGENNAPAEVGHPLSLPASTYGAGTGGTGQAPGRPGKEGTAGQQRSPGERYAEVYEINLLRCMFCGYCEEACPTGAIVLRREFALADYSRKSLIYTQDRLLQPAQPHATVLDDQER